MSLFASKLLKFLAMLVAVMTATISQPVIGCVCPDGRVKFFCSGPPSLRCHCPGPATTPSAGTGCDSESGHSGSCCHRRHLAAFSAAMHTRAEVKSSCCHRTILVDGAAFTAKVFGDGEETFGSADPLAERALVYPILRVDCASLAKRPTVAHLPPPDLIITHCHFTC